MKLFLPILLLCINSILSSNYLEKTKLIKKCNKSDKTLCKEISKFRTKYKIEAFVDESAIAKNSTTRATANIINLGLSLNKCKSEDCDYCCLSTNRCGSQKQCENSKYINISLTKKVFHVLYLLYDFSTCCNNAYYLYHKMCSVGLNS